MMAKSFRHAGMALLVLLSLSAAALANAATASDHLSDGAIQFPCSKQPAGHVLKMPEQGFRALRAAIEQMIVKFNHPKAAWPLCNLQVC